MKTSHFLLLISTLACATFASAEALDNNTLIKQADALDARLENRKALELYQEVEKSGPPSVDLLCKISRQYGLMMTDTTSVPEKKELGAKAIEYSKRAVEADEHNGKAQMCLAACYGRLAPLLDNKTKVAYSKLVKEHADKALALIPNEDLVYHILGAWNYELSSLNPILRAFAKIVYGDIPASSFEKAEENFKKAIQLNPDRLANHVELGRTYAAMGKKEEARKELNRGLEMPCKDKDDPESKHRAHEALGKL